MKACLPNAESKATVFRLYVVGFPLPYPSETIASSGRLSGDCSGAHCWVSFYDPDHGWIPVDVSEGDKNPEMRDFFFGRLTPNRFKISEGRSIRLNNVCEITA